MVKDVWTPKRTYDTEDVLNSDLDDFPEGIPHAAKATTGELNICSFRLSQAEKNLNFSARDSWSR